MLIIALAVGFARTQSPFSSLSSVTLSTRPARTSVEPAIDARPSTRYRGGVLAAHPGGSIRDQRVKSAAHSSLSHPPTTGIDRLPTARTPARAAAYPAHHWKRKLVSRRSPPHQHDTRPRWRRFP